MSRFWLAIWVACALVSVAPGCDEPSVDVEAVAVVQGPPAIVSTTLDAPIVGGRYQLVAGRSYTATVAVDSGTISYLVRLEPSALSSTIARSPAFHDDRIDRNTGMRSYTFTVRPTTAGIFQVAFQLRDRGTGNVYQVDGGVATSVRAPAPPQLISTTINAPVVDGRYQLHLDLPYTVTVAIAAGEATTPIRLDTSLLDPSLQASPALRDDVIPAGAAPRQYTFRVIPTVIGDTQVAFNVRHRDTGALLDTDGGVAVRMLGSEPRIVSTTIPGVTPVNGSYPLEIGRRYVVKVRVQSGLVDYRAQVEPNEHIATPASANLHNPSGFRHEMKRTVPYHDIPFALTPTEAGAYQIGFMLRDRHDDGLTFGHDGGIHVVASAPRTGLYGTISIDGGGPLSGAQVFLDGSATPVVTDAAGFYRFPSPGPGRHTLRIVRAGFSPAMAVRIDTPSPGRRFDVALERTFLELVDRGATYTKYIDGSHGQTILHTVRLPVDCSEVQLDLSGVQIAAATKARQWGALVTINGGYFSYETPRRPYGYFYKNQFVSSVSPPHCGVTPVLGISGPIAPQRFFIEEERLNFANLPIEGGGTCAPTEDDDWDTDAAGNWIFDSDHNHISDVDQAMAAGPTLVTPVSRAVPTGWSPDHYKYWARTAIGIGDDEVWFVVADGEGLNGVHGASMPQLGSFFRDVLGAASAMSLDGGGSTQMLLRYGPGENDLHEVVRYTSEHWFDEPMTSSDVSTFVIAR